jgi:ABC-type transport system substrate-binding protein
VGIQVNVVPLEIGIFASRLEKGDFDAALNMWRSEASPTGLRQVWGSPHGSDIGANYGRYSNAQFDAIADSAATEFDATRRRAQYQRAYQLLVDDAPAVWLYEPRNFALISNRIEPVGMRADAWWSRLPEWRTTTTRVATSR